jgi:ATP-dependent RNA helicase DHX57
MPKNAHPPRGGQKKTAGAASASSTTKDEPKADVKGKGKAKESGKPESSKSGSGKPGAKGSSNAKQAEEVVPDVPKKPDTRTLIGGASWTGKLPLNIFSELCQKQKWNKPEYTMVCSPPSLRSM